MTEVFVEQPLALPGSAKQTVQAFSSSSLPIIIVFEVFTVPTDSDKFQKQGMTTTQLAVILANVSIVTPAIFEHKASLYFFQQPS